MAAVPSLETRLSRAVIKTTWGPLTSADLSGVPVNLSRYGEKTVYVRGTIGTANGIKMLGRNNSSGTGAQLHDLDGATLTGLADGDAEGIGETAMQEIWPEIDGTPDGTTSLYIDMVSRLDIT